MLRSHWIRFAAFAALAFGAARADALPLTLTREPSGQGNWVQVLLDQSQYFIRTQEFDAVLDRIAGISYCIDISKEIRNGEPADYTEVSLEDVLNGTAAGWLLANYRVDRDAADAQQLITALQLAIWELVYDETPDLESGRFQVVDAKGGGFARAIELLASIPREIDLDGLGVTALTSDNYQDQIFIPNIPEPGTAMLVALGIAAIAARRRA